MGAVFQSLEHVELDLDAPVPLGPPGVLQGKLPCGMTCIAGSILHATTSS